MAEGHTADRAVVFGAVFRRRRVCLPARYPDLV
nr:MAG TPA: hypothetical protein [Caudoviricetes sp.]